MTRSNGPFGPPGAPLRRRPGDSPFGAPQQQSAGQWPPGPPQGYGDEAPQPAQGYHFPPPEPQPAYGYSNPQLLGPQQWPRHGEPQAHEINYQGYGSDDPGPFQHGAHEQGYDDGADYGDEYFEDEEPRRGPRWFLITVALVGAIGVGGALAYTYRSLVAPNSRVPVVKADPNIKVRPDEPGGREFLGATTQVPVRIAGETATAASEERPPADEVGPRPVKTIPIAPSSAPVSEEPESPAIPGITLYQPPQPPAPAAAAPAAPAAAPAPEEPVAPEPPRAEEPARGPRRVTIGTPPPAVAQPVEEEPAAAPPPPPVEEPPVQTAAVAREPAPPPRADPPSPSLGYVAVLASRETSMDALKLFADMQQKYNHVLGNKTPDIQKADLSARNLGWMYRVVVGPPGSRSAAREVCLELKSAGYVGCWIKEY